MKKLMAVLSFLLVLGLLLAPMTATLAQAHGSGAGSGAGAPSGGSGAPAGGGSPSGAAAGAPAGASPSGDSGSPSSSMGGSPSSSPAISGPVGPRVKSRASKGAVVAPAETSNLSTPSAAVAGDWQGRHTMTGEVTKINQRKGTFSLKTADGTLDLHAPPDVLANVKKGDQMAVEIAVRPLP
jgi:hypothetical protein